MKELYTVHINNIEKLADLGSYVVDMQNDCWIGSENLIQMLALPTKKEYTVDEFYQIIHPEDRLKVFQKVEEAIAEKRDFDMEYRCVKPDGEVIWVIGKSIMIYDDQNQILQAKGIIRNVTDQRQREGQLKELNRLLEKKDHMLGAVAHDLLSPLSLIDIYASLLKEDTEVQHHETIDQLIAANHNAKHISSELIELTKLKRQSFLLNLSSFDLSELISQSLNDFQFMIKAKSIQTTMVLSPNLDVHWDKKKIKRVLDNLLSNAIKFTPDTQGITIHTKQLDDDIILIEITDEGVGIEPEHFPVLFEAFSEKVRRPGTRGEVSTGLGLSIVKEIINMHHGEIKVTSKINKGTTFSIYIKRQIESNHPLLNY